MADARQEAPKSEEFGGSRERGGRQPAMRPMTPKSDALLEPTQNCTWLTASLIFLMIVSPSAVPSSVLKPFIAAITPAITSATRRIAAAHPLARCLCCCLHRSPPVFRVVEAMVR
jgi:hypothetical protein